MLDFRHGLTVMLTPQRVADALISVSKLPGNSYEQKMEKSNNKMAQRIWSAYISEIMLVVVIFVEKDTAHTEIIDYLIGLLKNDLQYAVDHILSQSCDCERRRLLQAFRENDARLKQVADNSAYNHSSPTS